MHIPRSVGQVFLLLNSLLAVAYSATPSHGLSEATLQSTSHVKQIAIIGAGSAGSSTAYHLRKFASESDIAVNITLFEQSSFVGGRSTTVNAYDDPKEQVELGASIFVDVNAILSNATRDFGLTVKKPKSGENDLLGVFDGERFVLITKDGDFSYWDLAKMFWKYGWSPVRTQKLMKKTITEFLKLYDPPFFPFRSLSARANDLSLVTYSGVTGKQLLEANKIYEPFASEIVQASTRVNYAMNLHHIHGLETMVCMAIEGAKQIDGGNWRIFDSMIKASNSNLNLNTTVDSISKSGGSYSVKTTSINDLGEPATSEDVFDTVVLAAPYQYADISMPRDLLKHTPDKIPYVRLHVTLFTSPHKLGGALFGLKEGETVPSTILTTLPQGKVPEDGGDNGEAGLAGFFSISTLRPIKNPKTGQKEYLYKIFSPTEFGAKQLSILLEATVPDDLSIIKPDSGHAITWIYPYVWNSYPEERPRVTFEEIELARHFYYTSGMESFISSMETMALSGMNVARLIVNDLLNLGVDEKFQELHSAVPGQLVIEKKAEL